MNHLKTLKNITKILLWAISISIITSFLLNIAPNSPIGVIKFSMLGNQEYDLTMIKSVLSVALFIFLICMFFFFVYSIVYYVKHKL
ncbi:hypothetical protein P343_15330 [Sporolactobacillus laevolacticus DSM 442]|uniref:Uncharacterized protein n=1 Tax=Sporolactobacillus laevolacticus DSM 442 TaxID=1395513 RepID=V6IW72_9BACL|nr:hypothetical protein P343_15330 [Sporolactobacillus laevolacticus DSM 442]